MTVETERRDNFRKRPLSLVYVELASGNGGMMRDICEEGFALRAMMPLRPGESTHFEFSLDANTRVEGEGRMIWVEEGGRVAGLEFTNVSAESMRCLQSWLQRADEVSPPSASEDSSAPAKTASPALPSPKTSEFPGPRTTVLDQLRYEARTAPVRSDREHPVAPKSKSDSLHALPPVEIPHAAHSHSDVAVFPAPKSEPPREAPTAEELKREIAEALRQAAAERAPEEPGAAAAPPVLPAPPPLYVAPVFTPPPAALVSEAESAPRFERHWQPLEPLPLHPADDPRRPRSGFTLARALGLFALIALGAAAYLYRYEVGQYMIEAGQKLSGSDPAFAPPPANSAASAPAIESPRSTKTDDPAPGPAIPAAEPSNTAATNSAGRDAEEDAVAAGHPAPSTVAPVSPLISGSRSAAGANSDTEYGQSEYLQAVQLLRTSKARDDQAEAARLLWTAVERGNSNAEVALAELYRLGQGVAQNCDQARVLLTAAARKGNPEATRHLQLFEQAGCE